ncbi:aminotransferase class III-fold pyridoxal phosphate-dependent enzyme [Mesorhizobium japonicum]|uniref:aminotransferase class III-fold pyridoxal phosphate-dependent enzyme n=1 Tax=Mesorhizobium TaxID=68287 RepID=UPI0031BA65CB
MSSTRKTSSRSVSALRGFQRIQKKRNRSVIGDTRGLGAMIGVELVEDEETRKPARSLTVKVIKEAADRGLLLASAGRHFNVLRFLVPLTISDEIIDESLNIIEVSIDAVVGNDVAAGSSGVTQAS